MIPALNVLKLNVTHVSRQDMYTENFFKMDLICALNG